MSAKKLRDLEIWFTESGTFAPGQTWAVPSGYYYRTLDVVHPPEWQTSHEVRGEVRGPFKTENEVYLDAARN